MDFLFFFLFLFFLPFCGCLFGPVLQYCFRKWEKMMTLFSRKDIKVVPCAKILLILRYWHHTSMPSYFCYCLLALLSGKAHIMKGIYFFRGMCYTLDLLLAAKPKCYFYKFSCRSLNTNYFYNLNYIFSNVLLDLKNSQDQKPVYL